MAVILGAIKGVSRGVLLFLAVAVFPSVAGLVAALLDGAYGLGFLRVFFAVIGIQLMLGVFALFGIASEVQRSHAAALARPDGERSSEV